MALMICTEHGNYTFVHGAEFQNDLATQQRVMDRRGLARFEFKRRSGRIPYIAAVSTQPQPIDDVLD